MKVRRQNEIHVFGSGRTPALEYLNVIPLGDQVIFSLICTLGDNPHSVAILSYDEAIQIGEYLDQLFVDPWEFKPMNDDLNSPAKHHFDSESGLRVIVSLTSGEGDPVGADHASIEFCEEGEEGSVFFFDCDRVETLRLRRLLLGLASSNGAAPEVGTFSKAEIVPSLTEVESRSPAQALTSLREKALGENENVTAGGLAGSS